MKSLVIGPSSFNMFFTTVISKFTFFFEKKLNKSLPGKGLADLYQNPISMLPNQYLSNSFQIFEIDLGFRQKCGRNVLKK